MSEVENRKKIIAYITENNITTRDELRALWESKPLENITREKVEKELSIFKQYCATLGDIGLKNSNTSLLKQKLKAQDKLNYHSRAFTKSLREINALEELNQELINSLKVLQPEIKTAEIPTGNNEDGVGVICLSDLHLNELIDIPSNKYDFEVASKRLQKLATLSIKRFKDQGLNKVVVCFLGDQLNSDRRMSEVFNMATNRSKACVLAFYLLKQFLEDLLKYFRITIASVTGNESRVVGDEYCTSDLLATYNYDYTLEQMLRIYFDNNPNVSFVDGEYGEKVISINGSNVLLSHGVNIGADIEKSVAQTFGRYAGMGVTIDYFFFGHKHSSRIGDTYARSSSLCGANSYSEGTLNLTSRASQLIGVFYPDKTNIISKIDLQNTDGYNGYDVKKELEAYNIKSTSKMIKALIHNI